MPPFLAPLTPATAEPANPAPASPSAEAVIPPAVTVPHAAPVEHEHVAVSKHPAAVHRSAKSATERAKFAALMRRLVAGAHHARTPVIHVGAIKEREPSLPPGTLVPPPGYYPPPPYERLVYGAPPRGVYGGWGPYRGRYPYY